VLQGLVVDPLHEFLTDRSQPSVIDWGKVLGNKQTTDAYLLSLAADHQARLLTLNQRLVKAFPASAVELLR